MNSRLNHLIHFYDIIEQLEYKTGGKYHLKNCNGRMNWSQRGVYFFMEEGESRSHSGDRLRIVRIGTHALKTNSKSTLWRRLSQHKGTAKNGGGNHRGSIFRLLVGTAIINDTCATYPTWGEGNTAKGDIRKSELPMEQKVSNAIGAMPFLCLPINDSANPESLRGYIERNSIALLSNWRKEPVDTSSDNWLGQHCNRERVRLSGLWNQNHVDENYELSFLDVMEQLVDDMKEVA